VQFLTSWLVLNPFENCLNDTVLLHSPDLQKGKLFLYNHTLLSGYTITLNVFKSANPTEDCLLLTREIEF